MDVHKRLHNVKRYNTQESSRIICFVFDKRSPMRRFQTLVTHIRTLQNWSDCIIQKIKSSQLRLQMIPSENLHLLLQLNPVRIRASNQHRIYQTKWNRLYWLSVVFINSCSIYWLIQSMGIIQRTKFISRDIHMKINVTIPNQWSGP